MISIVKPRYWKYLALTGQKDCFIFLASNYLRNSSRKISSNIFSHYSIWTHNGIPRYWECQSLVDKKPTFVNFSLQLFMQLLYSSEHFLWVFCVLACKKNQLIAGCMRPSITNILKAKSAKQTTWISAWQSVRGSTIRNLFLSKFNAWNFQSKQAKAAKQTKLELKHWNSWGCFVRGGFSIHRSHPWRLAGPPTRQN